MINPQDYLILTSVEDTPYMNWQLELLAYSVTQMGRSEKVEHSLFPGSNICAVVHSEHPHLSKYFHEIVNTYGINYIRTRNYGAINKNPYFKSTGTDIFTYKPKNKACALGSAFSNGIYSDYKYTLLTDSDVFAYKFLNVQKFPTRKSAIAEHWLCDSPVIDAYPNDQMSGVGIDLKALMRSMKVPEQFINKYSPGGCIVFLRSEDYSELLVNSIHGYTELIRSVCTITQQPSNWCIEMPVYALGLAHCGIHTDLISEPEFCDANCGYLLDGGKTIVPEGSLPHYGYQSAWKGTDFGKWDYPQSTPFEDLDRIKQCEGQAEHPIGRAFFQYCREIGENVRIDRSDIKIKVDSPKTYLDLTELEGVGRAPEKGDILKGLSFYESLVAIYSWVNNIENRNPTIVSIGDKPNPALLPEIERYVRGYRSEQVHLFDPDKERYNSLKQEYFEDPQFSLYNIHVDLSGPTEVNKMLIDIPEIDILNLSMNNVDKYIEKIDFIKNRPFIVHFKSDGLSKGRNREAKNILIMNGYTITQEDMYTIAIRDTFYKELMETIGV